MLPVAFSCSSAGRESESIISACRGGSQEIKSCRECTKQPTACTSLSSPSARASCRSFLSACCSPSLWMVFNEEGWEISLLLLFCCFQALEGLQWLCLPPKCSHKFLRLPRDAAAIFQHSLQPGIHRIWLCSVTNCPCSCFLSHTHCLGISTVPSCWDTGCLVARDAQEGAGVPVEQLLQNPALTVELRLSGGLFLMGLILRALPCSSSSSLPLPFLPGKQQLMPRLSLGSSAGTVAAHSGRDCAGVGASSPCDPQTMAVEPGGSAPITAFAPLLYLFPDNPPPAKCPSRPSHCFQSYLQHLLPEWEQPI